MSSYLNIYDDLIDEISLEGLEGITFETLWVRLKDSNYSLDVSQVQVQSYIWSNIILQKAKDDEFEFFLLPKPRKTVKLYNRYDFINQETGSCFESDDIPIDVYGTVTPISDGNIRGSCQDYDKRKNITKQIIGTFYCHFQSSFT